MKRDSGWILVVMVAALGLVGCEKGTARSAPEAPATVEKQASGPSRVTLRGRAAERLGIEFVEVTQRGQHLEAPYGALVYDSNGGEWVFISPAPNVFVRTEIKVTLIEWDKVYYSEGPPAGTKVITAGAAELLGIEFGIGSY